MEFLPDATDFSDMEIKPMPVEYRPDYTELCPKCKGYGGWNLQLNVFKGATPEQRHFRAFCPACWGWGWHKPGECAHEWDGPRRSLGRCLHEWTCSKCGETTEVDSSG